MSYRVEAHFNATAQATIPEYWTPELESGQVMPCETREEADKLESELND